MNIGTHLNNLINSQTRKYGKLLNMDNRQDIYRILLQFAQDKLIDINDPKYFGYLSVLIQNAARQLIHKNSNPSNSFSTSEIIRKIKLGRKANISDDEIRINLGISKKRFDILANTKEVKTIASLKKLCSTISYDQNLDFLDSLDDDEKKIANELLSLSSYTDIMRKAGYKSYTKFHRKLRIIGEKIKRDMNA